MEDTLESIIATLQKFEGAPAGLLTLAVCIVVGYVLRSIKRFPNDAIPIVAILVGGVFYPLIADDNNDWTLRVWIVRNAGIGLVYGLVAWGGHKFILKRIEDKIPFIKSLIAENETQIINPPETKP